MNRLRRRFIATSLCAFAVIGALDAMGCASAVPVTNELGGGIVAMQIVDRPTGHILDFYPGGGSTYVLGTPGHEYRLHLRNLTPGRVLVVASVDGVNIVTGETASPAQSGYVLGPWETLDVDGWRTSLARTAAFYFTDLGSSYAARTGRPNDVGVIGVAVFRERVVQPIPPMSKSIAPRDEVAGGAVPPSMNAPSAEARADRPANGSDALGRMQAAKPAPSLGTGYGRDETSYAQRVAFERATSQPAEMLSVRYDSRENLVAMGVLPRPRIVGRAPDPFPGQFVAPPPAY